MGDKKRMGTEIAIPATRHKVLSLTLNWTATTLSKVTGAGELLFLLPSGLIVNNMYSHSVENEMLHNILPQLNKMVLKVIVGNSY